jgi:hypothetical protein
MIDSTDSDFDNPLALEKLLINLMTGNDRENAWTCFFSLPVFLGRPDPGRAPPCSYGDSEYLMSKNLSH